MDAATVSPAASRAGRLEAAGAEGPAWRGLGGDGRGSGRRWTKVRPPGERGDAAGGGRRAGRAGRFSLAAPEPRLNIPAPASTHPGTDVEETGSGGQGLAGRGTREGPPETSETPESRGTSQRTPRPARGRRRPGRGFMGDARLGRGVYDDVESRFAAIRSRTRSEAARRRTKGGLSGSFGAVDWLARSGIGWHGVENWPRSARSHVYRHPGPPPQRHRRSRPRPFLRRDLCASRARNWLRSAPGGWVRSAPGIGFARLGGRPTPARERGGGFRSQSRPSGLNIPSRYQRGPPRSVQSDARRG